MNYELEISSWQLVVSSFYLTREALKYQRGCLIIIPNS